MLNLGAEYTRFMGSKKHTEHAHVGFLINTTLLEGMELETHNGKHSEDTYFLIIKKQNMRTTCLMNVYGKSNPSAAISRDQWASYTIDLQATLAKTPPNTDVIFLGDINARVGKAESKIEERIIGRYGEKNAKRNLGGKLAIEFLQECNLKCINARTPSTVPPYTFHSRAKGYSLIDIIAISRTMHRKEYEAQPLEHITLTGKEDHLPVVCSLRVHRKVCKPKHLIPKLIYNLDVLKSEKRKERFVRDRDSSLIKLLMENEREQENEISSREMLNDVLNMIEKSVSKHIGKRQVFHKRHTTRSMKKERKLHKEIKAHCKKHKSQMHNPESAAYKKMQNMKKQVTELQSKHAKEKERYLDRAMCKSYEQNDARKLTELVKSYQEGGFKSLDTRISCVKDEDNIVRTNTHSIHRAFRNRWRRVFCHEKDIQDLHNFRIDPYDIENNDHPCNEEIRIAEIQEAMKRIKLQTAGGPDNILPEFLCGKKTTILITLQILFNKMLNDGTFPKKLKTDRRTPIFKNGGDKTSVNDYRLLAVHSVFRKIFCSILDKRIRSSIKLDDAQNGFRKNRRGTDNVLILNNLIRQQGKKSGAYIIVVDFSKAFDRCHIATLLDKLYKKGIKGKLLRIIKSMYTNAEAQLSINGKLGKPFKVTRGVAQGCTLSPLLFDIYIYDLLSSFRDQGLGVPVGQITQGPQSFADDLVLIATDETMYRDYIRVLEKLCDKNFFVVNDNKSGILRVGSTGNLPPPNVAIKGSRILLLNEQDPSTDEDEINDFKYLGILLTSDGSWNKFHDYKLKKSKQTMGRFWKFFRYANISTKLKLRVAHALVLSHLSYGEEIMQLNPIEINQIDRIHASVLRTILQLPKYTSYNAMLYITGETRISTLMRVRRVSNLLRIKHLPKDTQLKKIYDQKTWHTKDLIFHTYDQDEKLMHNVQNKTSVSQQELTRATRNPPSKKQKLS